MTICATCAGAVDFVPGRGWVHADLEMDHPVALLIGKAAVVAESTTVTIPEVPTLKPHRGAGHSLDAGNSLRARVRRARWLEKALEYLWGPDWLRVREHDRIGCGGGCNCDDCKRTCEICEGRRIRGT